MIEEIRIKFGIELKPTKTSCKPQLYNIYIYIYICFHSYRQGNAIAHALIKRAKFSFSLLVWMEFVPFDIDNLVITDLPVS